MVQFGCVSVFSFSWLDWRPGAAYFWISHKISGLLTPLTPLDLYPQCLLKINLKQIKAIPPSVTWSHLTKGPYKRIPGQKYELLIYLKIRDFFEKIFLLHNWQKLYNFICTTKSNFWHQIQAQVPFVIWVHNPHLVFLLSFFFSLIYLFSYSSVYFWLLKATHIPCVAHEVT